MSDAARQLHMNKHAQKQHALTANIDAYARCLMQLAVANRAAASDHVCTALYRGGQRRRPAPEPSDTKCRGFGDGGTALVTLGDARAPSQSCGAASFYLERRARFHLRSAVLLGSKAHDRHGIKG